MKQQTVNEFKDGLNLDIHPLVTPKTVLTDNINGTFITYNGNEFCLQNDRGNIAVSNLSSGYTPIGIKEHNGILYIVSVNGNKTEIGTFPSPNYGLNNFEVFENLLLEYQPLHVLEDRTALTEQILGYTVETPITIEIQDSYDGSVNLILVANGKIPRIINSGFSVNGEKYKFINRQQSVTTNIYNTLTKESELIRTSEILTNVDLLGVQSGGQWKGGNYTFYIKFGDADYNQTDIVAESGIVSIFNGNDGVPSTVSGTLLDERTDKMIHLKITGLNTVYSKLYIYFTREYSDSQGYRMTDAGVLSEPIDINPENPDEPQDQNKYQNIWLTGFEQQSSINIEELNVDYHTIDWARAEAQHSNMLFLGNVGQEETFKLYQDLDKFTKDHVIITAKQTDESLNTVTLDYNNGDEYYSTHNIYYNLGYWPDEIYRFGIVYVLNDGSTTPVFNITGGFFEINETDPNDVFYEINKNNSVSYPTNDSGVVLTPNVKILGTNGSVQPLYFNFKMDTNLPENTIGWFAVRQKRIPRTICQGLSIGIDEKSHLPLLKDENGKWNIESFLSYARNILPEEDVLAQIEDLEDQTQWWKYLIDGLAWLTFLPTLNTITSIDLIRRWRAENKLDNIFSEITEAPKLEYLQKTTSTYIPDQIYIAIRTEDYYSEQTYDDFSADFSANFDEGGNAIVDTTLYDNPNVFQSGDMVYDCEHKIYLATKNVNEQGVVNWIITPEVNKVYYLSDSNEVYPTSLNFVYNGNSISAEVAGRINEEDVVPFLTALYNQEEVCNLLKRLIIENDEALGANGLLSLDPCVNSTVAGILDGSKFKLIPQYNMKVVDADSETVDHNSKFYNYEIDSINSGDVKINRCTYISPNTNIKAVVDGNTSFEFSNVAGSAGDISQYKKVHDSFYVVRESDNSDDSRAIYKVVGEDSEYKEDTWEINNINIVRGLYCPYIGVSSKMLDTPAIYSVRLLEQGASITELMKVREQDGSEYYCISKKTNSAELDVFRGDCYTNTVSIRINRNFIDPTVPVVEQIVDEETWAKSVLLTKSDFNALIKDKPVKEAIWDQVNAADVNTVDLGMWATFKCLSSYNLGLRSKDYLHSDEIALLGSPRSFYPLNGASTTTGNKMEESFLLNDGLSATVGRKRYGVFPETAPYSKSEFANRIMFSNVNVTDAYTNGYRTFQGLSYKDYDKQYGAITKLIALGQNIFIVMEHGLGLVTVNPKALMQTTTGEAIHIYGYGVLPNEITVISQDYGSKYEHSVIRTPIGIYGIDVDALKIWRFSDRNGFETISDMKVETYLKDNLKPITVKLGTSDVRTHYNAKKGDLMFTWYFDNKLYSICYNERQNMWITKYDWCPIVSENINDEFYSLNIKQKQDPDNPDLKYYIWDHRFNVAFDGTHVSTWYDNDNGFEFEFVVSDPIGVNKIFDNIQIISNNVQPTEMEITVIGDDYEFNRKNVPLESVHSGLAREEYADVTDIRTTSDVHGNKEALNTIIQSPKGYYHFNKRLNQSVLTKWQPFKDIYKFGRRIGNIQYKDGVWFAQIDPLLVNDSRLVAKEARIRDKWAKIRIRYSGKDLAIITAIKTLINI